jgi:aryl carrier-like protein
MLKEKILVTLADVYQRSNQRTLPPLTDDSVLLETGLDSLGFAVLVTRLEEELGYDPFTLCSKAIYPRTFREFVQLYEQFQSHDPAGDTRATPFRSARY